MEVSVVGKTMTPLPHNHISHIEFDTSSSMRDACVSLPRRHSEVKLPVKFLVDARREKLLYSPIYDRSKLSITPILQKMTLAETYNFARAQLNSQPLLELRHCKTRTPTLNFNRVNSNSKPAAEKKDESKEFEVSTSATPLISCKTSKVKDPEVPANESSKSEKDENMLNQVVVENFSSPSSRKRRKKSSKRRKRHRQITPQTHYMKRSGNIPPRLNLSKLPSEISPRSKLLPPKTQQSSFITFRSAFEKQGRKDELVLPSPTKFTPGSSLEESIKRGNINQSLLAPGNESIKQRCSHQSLSRNVEWKSIKNDDLLSSLDSSLNKKAKLSMRIQLIHRYGNEDVISKHRELSRKREVADKMEKKNLELQANARLKEQQRAKIYALNQLMTKLEQEQFEEFNKQKRL